MFLRAPLSVEISDMLRYCRCERSEAISFSGKDSFVTEPVLSVAQRGRRIPRNDRLQPAGPFFARILILVTLCVSLSLTCSALAEEVVMPETLPPEAREIEVVYVEGRTPKVTLKAKAESSSPLPVQLSGPVVDLLPRVTQVRPFGACASSTHRAAQLTLTTKAAADGPCGHELELQTQGGALDALSYGTLHVRGEASGSVTLALADEEARRREDNVPLASLTGRFDARIPLTPAARRMDLRRVVSLVVLPNTRTSTLVLNTLAFEQVQPARQQTAKRGFWVWEYRTALTQGEKIVATCRRFGCTRLLIQMPSTADPDHVWQAYTQFLAMVQAQGIEAFALDGYPEAVYDLTPLLEKLHRLMAMMAGKGFSGVQLDIEPYILDGFLADESGFLAYLRVIDQVKAIVRGRARLSIVIPFWLTSQTVKGRPVGFSVMDLADEVAVMSYRTDVNELRTIADDILRYGDSTSSAVWLAVETRPLPLERHVVLRRETRRDLADAYLDRAARRLFFAPPPGQDGLDWFRVYHRVEVRPERLTFAGQSRQSVQTAVAAIWDTIPNPSLTGVLIHDFDGFLSLSE